MQIWQLSHQFVCIEGQQKRGADEIEPDDEKLERAYYSLLQEYEQNGKNRKYVPALEELFGKMSLENRKKYEPTLPCHDEDDIISADALSSLTPDNVVSLMVGNVKYCFKVDAIAAWLRTLEQGERKVMMNPVTRVPLTDDELAHIISAISVRTHTQEESLYNNADEEALHNLVHIYAYNAARFNWDRMPFEKISPLYLSFVFSSYQEIGAIANDRFLQFIRTSRSFWYFIMRKLNPEERHEDENEDLILLGLGRMNTAIQERQIDFFILYPTNMMFAIMTREEVVIPQDASIGHISEAYHRVELPVYRDGPYAIDDNWVTYVVSWEVDGQNVGDPITSNEYFDFDTSALDGVEIEEEVVANLDILYNAPLVRISNVTLPGYFQELTPMRDNILGQLFLNYPDPEIVPDNDLDYFELLHDTLHKYGYAYKLHVRLVSNDDNDEPEEVTIELEGDFIGELVDFIREYITDTQKYGPDISTDRQWCFVTLTLVDL